MRIFVYGTLKKNQFFHEQFLGEGKGVHVSDAHTGPGYTLFVDAMPHLAVDGNGVGVRGEVYEVDETVLKTIDRLEGHPTVYRREIIDVKGNDGETLKCWAYLRPKHLFVGRPGVTIEEEFV